MKLTSLTNLYLRYKTIILFLLTGGLTSVIYFSFFFLLWTVLSLNYHIAVSVAYLVGVLFYFNTNRRMTFKSQDAKVLQQFVRFCFMVLISYLITLLIVHGMVEYIHANPVVGIMIAIMITTPANYAMARWWVFNDDMQAVTQ